jgi:hypothetical protein
LPGGRWSSRGDPILSGPIGLEFAIVGLLLFGALLSRNDLRDLRSGAVGRAVSLSALILHGSGPFAGLPPYRRLRSELRDIALWHSLRGGVDQLPEILREAVGNLGSLSLPLPRAAYWIWSVLGLVAAAMWLGTRRECFVMVAVGVLALAFPVLFCAWVDRFTGYTVEGREVLPALMLVPLVAGEIVSRHSWKI